MRQVCHLSVSSPQQHINSQDPSLPFFSVSHLSLHPVCSIILALGISSPILILSLLFFYHFGILGALRLSFAFQAPTFLLNKPVQISDPPIASLSSYCGQQPVHLSSSHFIFHFAKPTLEQVAHETSIYTSTSSTSSSHLARLTFINNLPVFFSILPFKLLAHTIYQPTKSPSSQTMHAVSTLSFSASTTIIKTNTTKPQSSIPAMCCHRSLEVRCSICGATFSSYFDASEHVKEKHFYPEL